jgi:hypothetical protein
MRKTTLIFLNLHQALCISKEENLSFYILRVLVCVRKGRDSAAAFMRCSKTISGVFHYPGNQLDLAAADTLLCPNFKTFSLGIDVEESIPPA